MSNENLIHVKLEFEEALEGKKDILSTEADLLQLVKKIKNYQCLRQKELQLKTKLHKKIKTIFSNIKRLQISLPKIKIQEIPHHEISKMPNSSHLRTKLKSNQNNNQFDKELANIQERLRELGR